uniref:Endonuclease/exonuclease/phosphatase domain-containing protein n=1 Tax=Dendroctonus ponderosae TaxID=77166 RepID=A0AAR5PA78_DENPD
MTSKARKRKTREWKKQPLRIACWNVKSFNNKDQEIITELNEHKIGIFTIFETWQRGKGTSRDHNYILIYNGQAKTEGARSGVGLLIHDLYEDNIETIDYINNRILIANITVGNKPLHIISVYAPDVSKPDQSMSEFYENLESQIYKIPKEETLILLGDLKARIGKQVVDDVKQAFNEEVLNQQGEMLTEFCALNELRINKTFIKHKI